MTALSDPAFTTFCALLVAHIFADFLFQTNWMVANKTRFPVLLGHTGVVLVASLIALGGALTVALVVALAHLVIDAIKVWGLPRHIRDSLTAFLGDQAAHVAVIFVAALWWPMAAEGGLWASWLHTLLPPALLVAGFVLTVRAGGFAVGILMQRYQNAVAQDGLPAAGQVIGQLERTLIFFLVLINQPAGIGFLIAAKSVLRFDTAAQGQKAGEYVIIGTLASFAWALAAAYATHALLEIARLTP